MAKDRRSPQDRPEWPAALVAIAARFSPPTVDLRDGRISDDWGDDAGAPVLIAHRTIWDVRDEELAYYSDVFAFMDTEDLLFYLLPVCEYARRDDRFDCNFYLYSLEHSVPSWDKRQLLSADERKAIFDYLAGLFLASPDCHDWEACVNLQRGMGLL